VTKIDINVCRAIFNVQRIGFYRNTVFLYPVYFTLFTRGIPIESL